MTQLLGCQELVYSCNCQAWLFCKELGQGWWTNGRLNGAPNFKTGFSKSYMGVSMNGGTYPNSWMVYKGKSHLEMDDGLGHPHFWEPPYVFFSEPMLCCFWAAWVQLSTGPGRECQIVKTLSIQADKLWEATIIPRPSCTTLVALVSPGLHHMYIYIHSYIYI